MPLLTICRRYKTVQTGEFLAKTKDVCPKLVT